MMNERAALVHDGPAAPLPPAAGFDTALRAVLKTFLQGRQNRCQCLERS